MNLKISPSALSALRAHGEQSYPNEGAGFLFGHIGADETRATAILPLPNAREAEAQRNRYLISDADYLRGELAADREGLDLVGVFHSHPDHPARPSEFDREYALPNFSYIITAVQSARAAATRSWRLRPDRSTFDEEEISVDS